MATRIAGVNIKEKAHVIIGLTAIYGIGRSRSQSICIALTIDPTTPVKDLTEEQLNAIRQEVTKYRIEGDLRREVSMNIKRKMDIRCYQGLRHRNGLPVRGQNTHNNSRTRKGKRKQKG